MTAAGAQDDLEQQISDALAQLADPDASNPEQIESRIVRLWSRSGSDSIDFLLERGRDALSDGDPVTAVEHFTAAIDHAPGFAEAWNGRATAYFQMEEYGLSIQDISQTLTLNPSHFGALSGLGYIYERLDRPALAYAAFRAAAAFNPHSEGVQGGLRRTEIDALGREI